MGKENKKRTRICRVGRGRIEKVGKKGGGVSGLREG